MSYIVFTYQDMCDEITQAIEEAKKSITFPEKCYENVYDRLFEGFDVGLLNLFCVQIVWTLDRLKKDPLKSALLAYAEKIIDVFPILAPKIKRISGISAILSMQFTKAKMAWTNSEECLPYLNSIKDTLVELLCDDAETDKELFQRLYEITSFIETDLMPAYGNKKEWSAPDLEKCLTNDKFLHGTASSLKNLTLLFRFIRDTAVQSNQIIQETACENPDTVAFAVVGQESTWALSSNVSLRLKNELDNFNYTKPPW